MSHADGIMPSFSAQVVLEGPEEPEANEEEEVLYWVVNRVPQSRSLMTRQRNPTDLQNVDPTE